MSSLVLVRHAQSATFEENPDRLTAAGEQQAFALGAFWRQRGIHFDQVYCGEFERHCRTAIELGSATWAPSWFLGAALMQQGHAEEALTHFRAVVGRMGPHPMTLGGMCCVLGWMGRTDEARQYFAEFEKAARSAPVLPLGLAWAYIGVGDGRVFEALARAVDAHAPGVTCLPSLFIYDRIRADPRFQRLMEQMGLTRG